MDGSVQLSLDGGSNNGGKVKRMKKDPGAANEKSVIVLKHSDVMIRNGKVFMPNTIEMAQLKKPAKGQFKTNVQFFSTMTEMDVRSLLEDLFPFLRDQRLYYAAAVDNRTRLDFHGTPRIWNGLFIRRNIKGNSALYVLTDEGEIEALAAQNSNFSDTGFCDQERIISSNGFSETAEPDNSSVPNVALEHLALFEVVEDIVPEAGSLEGGYKFIISLTEPLPPDVTSGIAQFKEVNSVPLQKSTPCTFVGIVPFSSKAGDVDVTVLDQTGKRLGMTTFRYVDVQREMVKQLVSDKEKQCFWFAMWAQECGFLGSNNNASQSGGPVNMQDQGQTKEQESLQFLQLLVYTAAETDAQEFIEMIFSTSAGRIIFNSYKDKTPLPEHVARANGHSNLAQYLQDVNTRLSKEVSSEVQSNAIDWLELEKAVQKQVAVAQGKSIKQENCRSESDDNSSDYFAGAKTSSQGSSDIDEWSQSASDSDSSIGTEPCNEAELSIEGLSKRPTNHKEDSSSETPFEEKKLPDNKEERDTLGWGFTDGLSQWLGKGRKREASAAKPLDSKDKIPFEEMKLPDSQEDRDALGWGFTACRSQWLSKWRKREATAATPLDNKDKIPFEEMKPPDSKEDRDTLGWRFTDSPSQWLSKKKKKKKKEDERNSTTFRMFLLATFLCLRHASSFFFRLLSSFFFDTSGQANVHSTGNTQVVTDYLEAQRAQIEDFTVFNMQKIVTKNADIAYYLKPTESARRRPDLEEGDVIDFLTNAKMGQTEIEKQSYENSPRALMSDVIGLSAQIVITNHIFQERMQVKFEDTMIKDRSRWLKGLTWKLVLLLIIAAVFTTILYMLLAPGTLSQYQMCKKGSIKDHTAYFENFGIDQQYLKVNGIEFTWEKLTEKLDIHDCAKYNATGMRYYLNLERCAYFGKILLDHKPQIRGPELFALNDKCSKVYYVECDIHKWKQYTTAVNIKCSPPN